MAQAPAPESQLRSLLRLRALTTPKLGCSLHYPAWSVDYNCGDTPATHPCSTSDSTCTSLHSRPVLMLSDGVADAQSRTRCTRATQLSTWSLYLHCICAGHQGPPLSGFAFANVAATINGNATVASAYTLTLSPSVLIFPQLTASSGRAPASLPSNSWPVLM
jgi:hypothetical protein